jgi:D-methionine transport system ATP-binding protein
MNSTIYENVAFPLRIAKRPESKIKKRVTELLETVGLTDKANAYPATLSGGQKQRVGIARALATSPELVICDEATSALDPDTTQSILALIKKINEETGVTFLVITHEMDVIKALCTHVAIMEGGKIIEMGKVLDVLTNPQTDTAKRFFLKEYVNENWLVDTTPKDQSSKICSATFKDDSARRPFINDVIRKFDIELSILSGNIESVGGTMVGSLVLEIIGREETVASALNYFTNSGVRVEVIDHV